MSKANKAAKKRQSQPGRTGATPDGPHLLQQAEVALANGQIDSACQILAQAPSARSTPQGQDLLIAAFTAQACERWEKPARALISLERALEVAPTDAELRRLHGTLLRRSGRWRAALADLDEAQRLAPGAQSIALEALLAHLAAGERGPGLVALAAGIGPAAAGLVAALLAAAAGDLAEAEQVLARVPQPLAKLMRAVLLLAKGEGHVALPMLRQSAADDSLPGLASAYARFYLGLAYARRRELPEAAQALEDALTLGLSRDLVRDHLAWVYNQLAIDAVLEQDLARAADWLAKLSEVGGPMATAARENVAYALRLCGQEKAREEDYDEAARLWAKALEITPRDFALRQNLAVALERADRTDEAIPHWHELVQQLAKGATTVGKGRRAGTAATEDEALRAHVRAVAHRHLADLYLEEDDVERAIVQLERALAVVPEDADTRSVLASLLIEWGELRKALPHYERLAAEQPDSVEGFVGLATVQRLLGNLDVAVEALERAYALAPDDPLIRVGLGFNIATRVLRAPAAAGAERDARRALELLPRGRVLGVVALGAAQLAQGNRREASRTFKRCLKEADDKANAALEVGRAYWRAGERDLAAAAWAEAMKKAKRSPERFGSLAVQWAKAGEIARCKECFQELLRRRLEADARDAAEMISALPQGAAFLRRALLELIPWALHIEDRMFIAEGLLRVGDVPSARPLLNNIAMESVQAGFPAGIIFVMDLDHKYRYRLLERKTAVAVSKWLDTNLLAERPAF